MIILHLYLWYARVRNWFKVAGSLSVQRRTDANVYQDLNQAKVFRFDSEI